MPSSAGWQTSWHCGTGSGSGVAWYDGGGTIDNCVAAYDAIGAASLADSYVDESGNGNAATPDVAPTWAYGTGWTFDGTSQILRTTTGLLNGYRDFSIVYRCNITAGAKRGLFFVGQSGVNDVVFIEHDRHFVRVSGSSTSISYTMATGVNVVGAMTHDNTATTVYKDGASVASGAGHANALNVAGTRACPFYVFQGSGGSAFLMMGTAQAMAIYCDCLTPAEVATLTTAMNVLPIAAGSKPGRRGMNVPYYAGYTWRAGR